MRKRSLLMGMLLSVSVVVSCKPLTLEPADTVEPPPAATTPQVTPTATAPPTATVPPSRTPPATVTVATTSPPPLVVGEEVVELQGTLEDGAQVAESLNAGRVEGWAFNVAGEEYATITLMPQDTALDLTLRLVAPDGEVVATADYGYAGDTETMLDVRLAETGEYLILVDEFFGEPGRYRLSVLLSEEPQFADGGRLQLNQVIMSELPADGEQVWTFHGPAGEAVNVVLTPTDTGFDAILELRSPDDRVLVSLDEGFSGDAEVIANYELEISGEYTIHVSGFGGTGGPYTLSLTAGEEATANFYDAGDLRFGDVRSAVFRANEAHAWFFDGLGGDVMTVVVTPLIDLDLRLWLLDAEVARLAEVDAAPAGERETITHTLPADGQHIVLAQEFFGAPGPYEIALEHGGNAVLDEGGALAPGAVVTRTLGPGRGTAWTFGGVSGQVVDVAATPVDEGDLILLLRDPAGNVVATVNDGLNEEGERLTFELTESGSWTLIVRDYFTRPVRYRLTITPE